MESVKQILGRSSSPRNIQDQKSKTTNVVKTNTSPVDWFAGFEQVAGATEALKAFRELASGKANWQMLLCYGTAGCGKTHLIQSLAWTLGFRAVNKWSETIRWLKRSMNPDPEWGLVTYEKNFKSLQERDALFLDDVGAGAGSTDWAWRELEDIVDYRYERNLLTVITTNLDRKAIPDRIVSRFRDAEKSRLVLNTAPDYRPLKGRK